MITAPRKTERMDLRLTSEQRDLFERAASMRGMSLTQWAVDRLTTSADSDISQAERIYLSSEAFDRFVAMMSDPVDPKVEALMDEKLPWDRI